MWPVKNPDGSWGGNDPNVFMARMRLNPFAIATIVKDQKKRYQLFGNAYAEIIVLPGSEPAQ
jgi:hypothetical protein